jgi:hypothetical protein
MLATESKNEPTASKKESRLDPIDASTWPLTVPGAAARIRPT